MLNTLPRSSPEIKGITHWINSSALTLAELRGKVVLIDFWTYSCINCIRTQPYLNAWYEAYHDEGFEIIGVHAPEFEFEKNIPNVERAVKDEEITYPVAMDNDYATWNSFDNHYWPAKYLIDQAGQIVYTHFGEGAYDEMERQIRGLLRVGGDKAKVDDDLTQAQAGQTPETYLGYERGHNFVNQAEFKADQAADYTVAAVTDGDWSLGGKWTVGPMGSRTDADNAVLRMGFSAKEVYLVMEGPKDAAASVKVNGKAVTPTLNGGADVAAGGRVHFDSARLYKLVSLPVFGRDQTLDVTFPMGVTIHAFTFGG